MIKTTRLIRPVIVHGPLLYYERSRACSMIRLKKEILQLFPDIYNEHTWFYQLEFWKDYATTIERIQEAQENEEGIPLLLWIRKEVRNG